MSEGEYQPYRGKTEKIGKDLKFPMVEIKKKKTTKIMAVVSSKYDLTPAEEGFIAACGRYGLEVSEARLFKNNDFLILRRSVKLNKIRSVCYDAEAKLDEVIEAAGETSLEKLMKEHWGKLPLEVTRKIEKLSPGIIVKDDFFSFNPLFSYCEFFDSEIKPFIENDKYDLVDNQMFKDLLEKPYKNKVGYMINYFRNLDLRKLSKKEKY